LFAARSLTLEEKLRYRCAHRVRDVRGDVGSILVDDSDNTQRDTQAFRAKSVVECSLVFDLEQGSLPRAIARSALAIEATR